MSNKFLHVSPSRTRIQRSRSVTKLMDMVGDDVAALSESRHNPVKNSTTTASEGVTSNGAAVLIPEDSSHGNRSTFNYSQQGSKMIPDESNHGSGNQQGMATTEKRRIPRRCSLGPSQSLLRGGSVRGSILRQEDHQDDEAQQQLGSKSSSSDESEQQQCELTAEQRKANRRRGPNRAPVSRNNSFVENNVPPPRRGEGGMMPQRRKSTSNVMSKNTEEDYNNYSRRGRDFEREDEPAKRGSSRRSLSANRSLVPRINSSSSSPPSRKEESTRCNNRLDRSNNKDLNSKQKKKRRNGTKKNKKDQSTIRKTKSLPSSETATGRLGKKISSNKVARRVEEDDGTISLAISLDYSYVSDYCSSSEDDDSDSDDDYSVMSDRSDSDDRDEDESGLDDTVKELNVSHHRKTSVLQRAAESKALLEKAKSEKFTKYSPSPVAMRRTRTFNDSKRPSFRDREKALKGPNRPFVVSSSTIAMPQRAKSLRGLNELGKQGGALLTTTTTTPPTVALTDESHSTNTSGTSATTLMTGSDGSQSFCGDGRSSNKHMAERAKRMKDLSGKFLLSSRMITSAVN